MAVLADIRERDAERYQAAMSQASEGTLMREEMQHQMQELMRMMKMGFDESKLNGPKMEGIY